MKGLLKKNQNAMESDVRNQQTNEDLTDAKLTIHRKPVRCTAATPHIIHEIFEIAKKYDFGVKKGGKTSWQVFAVVG
jgi:hypothetical protein